MANEIHEPVLRRIAAPVRSSVAAAEGRSTRDAQALARALMTLKPAERCRMRRALRLRRPAPKMDAAVAALTGGLRIGPLRASATRLASLTAGFARRHALLAGALLPGEVAALLAISPEAAGARAEVGTLLGLPDCGSWRFPTWQFDPDGPDGVVAGLPVVFAALPDSPFRRAAWLTTPHPRLGQVPIEALRTGHLAEVVVAARAVGAV